MLVDRLKAMWFTQSAKSRNTLTIFHGTSRKSSAAAALTWDISTER
jgi:hypothetical protein